MTIREELSVHGATFQQTIAFVNEGLDEGGLEAFDIADAQGRNYALAASMNASLRRFAAEERQRLWELAIFREEDEIPEGVVLRLWRATTRGALKPFAGRKLLRRLGGQFFQLRALQPDVAPTLHFHDRIREYLGEQLGGHGAAGAHRALLHSYNPPGAPWPEIEDDGYLHDHLVYHLRGAGQEEGILALLADDRWMRVRFTSSPYTYTGFISDVLAGWRVAEGHACEQIEAGQEPTAVADCLRCALIRSSINSLSSNYMPELVARALQTGLWGAERAMAVATHVVGPSARVEMLAALAPHLQGEMLQQALSSAPEIGDEEDRSSALAALAPHLQGEQREQVLQQALSSALEIGDEEDRSRALAALYQVTGDLHLLSELRRGLLQLLRGLENEDRQQLLRLLQGDTPFGPPLLGPETLAAIAGQIVEICERWRWQ